MRIRLTARVLLTDPDGRILLMKGRIPTEPDRPGEWFTVGGGAEPGETVLEAAAREIVEETGFTDFRLGPVVWARDIVFLSRRREPLLFHERYVHAWCGGGEPCSDGWQELERAFVDDLRWWRFEELQRLDETVHPRELIGLLPDILARRWPMEPIWLETPEHQRPAAFAEGAPAQPAG